MASNSLINTSFDEKRWVSQIQGFLQMNLEEAIRVPASIFQVPDSIPKPNPEAYIPTRVGLGPYHHFRPDLYHMEIYKLHKAKIARTNFQIPQFHHLVSEIKQRELTVRSCFDKYIAMDGETFAWVMLIDGLYLLWLLGISTELIENSVVPTRKKTAVKILAEKEVERDVLMLENQIPMEVLQKIMAGAASKSNEEILLTLLFNYCSIVSPFELERSCLEQGVLAQSRHLLHFLYNLILIPKGIKPSKQRRSKRKVHFSCLMQIMALLASIFNIGFIQQLSDLLGSLKSLSDVRESGRDLFSFEEIPDPLLPSASDLAKTGVKFKPSPTGIQGINFFRRSPPLTFELPLIRVNGFSEVILRNLVALEAKIKMGPPLLARYIGLMNGLVQTARDVKILQTDLILSNDLSSDEEVVELFSRLWKSTIDLVDSSSERSGDRGGDDSEVVEELPWETGLLEEEEGESEKLVSMAVLGKRIKVIEDVNKYYYSLKKVKLKKFLKKYVLSCLKIVFIVVIFCIFLLIILRTICSFFSCPKFLKSS